MMLGLGAYLSVLLPLVGTVAFDRFARRFLAIRFIQRPPTAEEYRKCMNMAVFNLQWLFILTLSMGPLMERTLLPRSAPLPGLTEVVAKLLLFLFLDDLWFYAYHRLVHAVPWLYVTLHKQHHLFTVPFPEVTLAVHPAELMLLSLGTCIGPLGIYYKQTHPLIFYGYTIVRQLQVFLDHFGWELKRPLHSPASLAPRVFGGTAFHDLHHQKFKCNYSSLFSVIDWAFGTAVFVEGDDELKKLQ